MTPKYLGWIIFIYANFFFTPSVVLASPSPTWVENELIPKQGRKNIYQLDVNNWNTMVSKGRMHSLEYPTTLISGVTLPYEPVHRFFEIDKNEPLIKFVKQFVTQIADIHSFDEALEKSGMISYPEDQGEGIYYVPYPNKGPRPEYRMGITLRKSNGVQIFSIGCTSCHAGQLFGKTIIGLNNRFPGGNELFNKAITAAHLYSESGLQWLTQASKEEMKFFTRAVNNLDSVESVVPQTKGLDTSLAQVALSLSKRNKDAYATKSKKFESFPRYDRLRFKRADSKVANWWTLKYKNKWLSDGSVVSGNPILTNFLWNEIGRGTELKKLEQWFEQNQKIIRELTSFVFSTEPPQITDFFPEEYFNLERAKRGETLFNDHCARCHGTYVKGWSLSFAENLELSDQLKTLQVSYHTNTPIHDVGTDPHRRKGMSSLIQLNDLNLSKKFGIKVKVQKGYVPPPLVGIWARWPYFHNNSIPSLCALLTKTKKRPRTYWAGEPIDPNTDFDFECNGYPQEENVPDAWKRGNGHKYKTYKTGLSNRGHDEGIFLSQGKELMSVDEKMDLIHYLQTL